MIFKLCMYYQLPFINHTDASFLYGIFWIKFIPIIMSNWGILTIMHNIMTDLTERSETVNILAMA